eukprot:scaffold3782_cov170-Amphora_coffeaeformis.AAC.12
MTAPERGSKQVSKHLFCPVLFALAFLINVMVVFVVACCIRSSQDEELRSFMQDTINDDPQLDPPIPFKLGTMAFAGSGPDSRTTQMFIAYGEIPSLGSNPWETPFGVVEDGIDNVIRFHSYGDMAPWGQGPNPHQIM